MASEEIVNEENMSENEEEENFPSSAFDRYSQEMLKSEENVKVCSQPDNATVKFESRDHTFGVIIDTLTDFIHLL